MSKDYIEETQKRFMQYRRLIRQLYRMMKKDSEPHHWYHAIIWNAFYAMQYAIEQMQGRKIELPVK
ncbi:hypothetical protein KAR91_35235 [Candidatus Pacearchaeota archaeon]|nr:hypothetical protein [Candidatus Pacearchaeota archaeon]